MREVPRRAERTLIWRIASRLLPEWFRARYGGALLEVHVQRAGGDIGARGALFWSRVLWDVLATGAGLRVDRMLGGTGDGPGRGIGPVGRGLIEELRYATRAAARRPGFAVSVAVTLGLGIGANVTMFSILDRLFLSPPAGVADAGRVRRLYVWGRGPFSGERGWMGALSYPDLEALSQTSGFEAIAGHSQRDLTLGHGERSERVKAELATASYFATLGVRPAVGRFYTPDEDRIGGPPTAVLSWAFWQRRFGGDAGVIGRELALGSGTYTVVGVGPAGFTGTELAPTDIWIPLRAGQAIEYGSGWETAWQWYWFGALVRLPAGRDARVAAETEATSRYRRARGDQKSFDRNSRIELTSIMPGRAPEPTREARVTRALGAIALLVLLIACANVANLLLARGVRQRRQHAVRAALGMGRGRLVLQMLSETLVLAVLGGGIALLLAGLLGPKLIRLLIPDAGNVIAVGDRTLLATTLLVTAATVLAGLLPSWRSSRIDGTEAMRARGSTHGVTLLRRGLLGFQAALSVVLLVGAGLFVRSLQRAESLDLGFSGDVLTVGFELENGETMSADHSSAVYAALARLRSDPRVASAAATSMPPFSGLWALSVDVPGPDSILVGADGPQFFAATGDYFETMGMPVVRGRALTDDDDRAGAPPVAVVSESMAKAVWPGRDALGQCLLFPAPEREREATVRGAGAPPAVEPTADVATCTTVVGVVRDHLPSVTAEAGRQTYYLAPHHFAADLAAHVIVLRPNGNPATLIPHILEVVRAAAPDIRYVTARPMSDRIRGELISWRLGATLLSLFGVLALLVAGAGFYSVVAFDVAQRRFELSVRKALGAPGRKLVRTVAAQSLLVTAGGVLAGLVAALALGRVVESMLFRVSPTDALTYATVCATLLLAAAIAGAAPAVRAMRADPALALREEV